jgi:sugar (pentulose or hexulose) kinase
MNFIGVDESLMPRIEQTGYVVGKLTKQAAQELGLSEELTVYNGAHDQYAAALGLGAIEAGDMILSTGTAWVNVAITEKPMFTPSQIAPAKHVVGSLWGALTSIPVAGKALDWFKSIAGEDYDSINENAAKRMESSKGLFFYPYHIGARLPHRLKNAKAAFIGLGLEHDKYDMYRAVMEGVVFQVKLTIDDFAANGAKIDTLLMAGGATKSDLWMSILSAVTGAAIYKSEQPDAACIGAAMIAAVGCGMAKDYNEAKDIFVKSELVPKADKNMEEHYKDKYARYLEAWDNVSEMYV